MRAFPLPLSASRFSPEGLAPSDLSKTGLGRFIERFLVGKTTEALDLADCFPHLLGLTRSFDTKGRNDKLVFVTVWARLRPESKSLLSVANRSSEATAENPYGVANVVGAAGPGLPRRAR